MHWEILIVLQNYLRNRKESSSNIFKNCFGRSFGFYLFDLLQMQKSHGFQPLSIQDLETSSLPEWPSIYNKIFKLIKNFYAVFILALHELCYFSFDYIELFL